MPEPRLIRTDALASSPQIGKSIRLTVAGEPEEKCLSCFGRLRAAGDRSGPGQRKIQRRGRGADIENGSEWWSMEQQPGAYYRGGEPGGSRRKPRRPG